LLRAPQTTVLTWQAPEESEDVPGFAGSFHFTFECEVIGGTGTFQEWHSPGDTAGPGAGGNLGEQPPPCADPPCTVPDGDDGSTDGFPQPGDFSRVLDCFEGTFTEVSFVGVEVPWVNVFRLPGDVLCAVDALFVPRMSDWRVLIRLARVSFNASSLGSVDDYITAPFEAVTSFASAANGGGCAGPAFDFLGYVSVQPFNACADPIASAANIVKTGLSALMIAGAVLVSARMLLQALGFNEASNVTVGDISTGGGTFGDGGGTFS
jgi:hypothetical protein